MHRFDEEPNSYAESHPILVLNNSEDVLTLIRHVFEDEGFQVITEHVVAFRNGSQNLSLYLHRYDPLVVVFDIGPPYETNYRYFQQIRTAHPERSFVLTTTSKQEVERLIDPTEVIEVVGKPFDLHQIVMAAKRALAGDIGTR